MCALSSVGAANLRRILPKCAVQQRTLSWPGVFTSACAEHGHNSRLLPNAPISLSNGTFPAPPSPQRRPFPFLSRHSLFVLPLESARRNGERSMPLGQLRIRSPSESPPLFPPFPLPFLSLLPLHLSKQQK
ncbi:hypothetical protein niasHT_021145 [Heterodera trifolii]|uniref:Uncharacterized protein n=1 Tax=Heterodera trifolii TaxID=157864 RepID=A0ABD2JF09_9BILA